IPTGVVWKYTFPFSITPISLAYSSGCCCAHCPFIKFLTKNNNFLIIPEYLPISNFLLDQSTAVQPYPAENTFLLIFLIFLPYLSAADPRLSRNHIKLH